MAQFDIDARVDSDPGQLAQIGHALERDGVEFGPGPRITPDHADHGEADAVVQSVLSFQDKGTPPLERAGAEFLGVPRLDLPDAVQDIRVVDLLIQARIRRGVRGRQQTDADGRQPPNALHGRLQPNRGRWIFPLANDCQLQHKTRVAFLGECTCVPFSLA